MTNNILPFHKPGKQPIRLVREQAAVWLARLDADPGRAVPDELIDWLRRDRQHLQVMLEMATLWDQSSVLEELSAIFPLEGYDCKPPRDKTENSSKAGAWWVGAGSVMLLCLLAIMLPMLSDGEKQSLLSEAYDTMVGEQKNVSLPDGSQITLNTNTHLQVDYKPNDRNITLLQGEALFQVAHDADRPFRVMAGNRVVEAVGTAFSVQHDEQGSNLEVMVTEGEVLLHRQQPLIPQTASAEPASSTAMQEDPGISLRAGQLLTVDENQDELVRQEVAEEEMQVRLSWQHGMLLFRNEPLENVLEEVARYTTTSLHADASVRDIKVEGYFRVGDIDGLLHAMQSNFHIAVQRTDEDHVYLSSQ